MKGFAITPFIFVAVAASTALLLHNYFSLSSQAAAALGAESALVKLRAAELKSQVDIASSLYWFSQDAGSSNCTEIAAYVNAAMQAQGRTGTARVQPGATDHFVASYETAYSGQIGQAALSSNLTVVVQVPGVCT